MQFLLREKKDTFPSNLAATAQDSVDSEKNIPGTASGSINIFLTPIQVGGVGIRAEGYG